MTELNPVDAMTNLSPAAAVLDAVCKNTEPDCDTQHLIAAGLRAAADQVVPEQLPMLDHADLRQNRIRSELLTIDVELEGHQ